ncbi:MAG: lactate oxidase [Pisciglobus halotolerans]|nr:lactate oxidase [Pisciglobus halotolerans]
MSEVKNMAYQAPETEGKIDFVNLYDLEKMAAKVIPEGGFGYISSGAGDLWTIDQNIKSFNHKVIVPRVLRDVENPDLSTEIFGDKLSLPIIMAPVASHGLANAKGEVATSKGVAASDTIFTISSYANKPFKDISEAGKGSPQWFQFYMSKDDDINRDILDEAKANGMKAVVLTADATVGGNREMDKRTGFVFPLSMPIVAAYQSGVGQNMDAVYGSSKQKLSPKDVKFIADYSGLPVIVKGIQSAADATAAIEAGAAAVWVTNHGGRQVDGGRPAFDSLKEVASAVNKRVPVIFDSGVRRGTHVFKAIAEGADLVAIGRPAIYGLALGGSEGVKEVFDFFRIELEKTMQLAGTHNVKEIKETELADYPWS